MSNNLIVFNRHYQREKKSLAQKISSGIFLKLCQIMWPAFVQNPSKFHIDVFIASGDVGLQGYTASDKAFYLWDKVSSRVIEIKLLFLLLLGSGSNFY